MACALNLYPAEITSMKLLEHEARSLDVLRSGLRPLTVGHLARFFSGESSLVDFAFLFDLCFLTLPH